MKKRTQKRSKNTMKNKSTRRIGGMKKVPFNSTVSGMYCSPRKTGLPFSCYNEQELINIAKKWNDENPTNVIQLNTSPQQLWKSIDEKMKMRCNTERCWSQKVRGGDIFENAFRPKMPHSWSNDKHYKNKWLSDYDINRVMQQYEKSHENFTFLGTVPLDFATRQNNGQCISPQMCQLNLAQLHKNGKTKIGVVLNLDYHDEPGSHWVSMFIDIERQFIAFYDSYSSQPNVEIQRFMEKIAMESKAINNGTPFKILSNTYRHQYKNTECGMYCIYFITKMLEGVSFDDFIIGGLQDDVMYSFRKFFFDPTHTV